MTEIIELKIERLKTALYIALYRRNKYPESEKAYNEWLRAKKEYEEVKNNARGKNNAFNN